MKARNSAVLMVAAFLLMMIGGPLYAAVSDAQIVSSTKNTYVFKTFLADDDIKVEAKDGVVTLTGVVSGPAHKRLAEATAAVVPGVKSVDNRLTIKDADPTANSDAWIKEKVETTLRLHRSVVDSEIEVAAKDGVITLTGITDNQATKELATAYAEDVAGVKKVNNKMTVSNSWKAAYHRASDYIDDASITAQVEYALLTHRSTSTLRTKVDTVKGVVTLSGKAKNAAEKILATLLANDINGVKAVKNQMTIK